jgi:hypothetical protein
MIRNKVAAACAAFALVSGGLTLAAAPAQAAYVCAGNTYCEWQNVGYGAGVWHTSFINIYQHISGGITSCLNISPATWPNGDQVADNESGLMVNFGDSTWAHYSLVVYNWVNCNPDGAYTSYPISQSSRVEQPDLRQENYRVNNPGGIREYQTITSIGVIQTS